MGFYEWWHETGSGVTVDRRDDHEEHAKKVAEIAWRAALEDAANKFDGTTAYNPTAADGYANAFDIASELRYMATETPNVQIEALPASGQSLSNAGLGNGG